MSSRHSRRVKASKVKLAFGIADAKAYISGRTAAVVASNKSLPMPRRQQSIISRAYLGETAARANINPCPTLRTVIKRA